MSKNFSRFDAMSTEALRDILYQDSFLPEGVGYDMDTILYIMQVLAKREDVHPSVDEAWRIFNEYYRSDDCDGASLHAE